MTIKAEDHYPLIDYLNERESWHDVEPDEKERILEWKRKADALEQEQERRIYYQNIVYEVCLIVEKALGLPSPIVCGTVEHPSTELQEALEEALEGVVDE